MVIDLTQGGVLELSLLLRAVAYAIFFTLLGILVIRATYPLSTLERSLGWVSVGVGMVNVFMAAEWLYLFIFTDAVIQ